MNSTAPPPPVETTIPIENSRQVGAIVSAVLSIVIPGVLVGLRFWARNIINRPLDASDMCVMAALVFLIGLHIDMFVMVLKGGFGFHGVDIVTRFGMDTLVLFLKGIVAFPILWNFTVCFSKLAVLLMYTSVIPNRDMILACRAIGLFIILWNLGGVLGALLMCRPFAKNWYSQLPGQCGSPQKFYMWLGIINIVVESVMLILPIPFLYRLQLKTYKKVVVIALFSVGWMTCAVTIYRQATLPHLEFSDMTYTGVLSTVLTGIEPAVALSLSCVPFLRPLMKGKNGDSTVNSGNKSDLRTFGSHGLSRTGGRSDFKELDSHNDNSSEVQLHPMGNKGVSSAEVGRDSAHAPPARGGGGDGGSEPGSFITVQKAWHVVSGDK